MARVKDNELTRLHGWPEGLDNVSRENELPMGKSGAGGKVSGRLREAENLDLDDEGKPSRRAGYSQVEALPDLHSLWADKRFPLMLAVYNGALVAFDIGENRSSLTTLLSRTSPMSYSYDAGYVYFTNRFDSGRIDVDGNVTPWAVEPPRGQPTLSANASGALAEGTYQVAVTFLDADGRESGSTLAAEIDLETGQGILLSNIPQPAAAGVELVRVYCTETNGEELYFVMDVPVGMTSAVVGAFTPTVGLATQFIEPLPPGDIVRIYRGYMYVIRDNVLYWSAPMQYGQGVLFNSYLKFNDRGTLLEGLHVDGAEGMFAAFGNRTYFLAGTNPKDWQRAIAHPYGAAAGSSTLADAKVLGTEADGDLPYWLDSNGQFVIGQPGGRVQALHADRYAAPQNVERAATVLREAAGMRHLITTFQGGVANPLAVTDRAEAEVWRNGVRVS